MGAVFYAYSTGNSIFVPDITVSSIIKFKIDNQDSDELNALLLDEDTVLITTNISVQTNETIQYFLSLGDFINWFHFGKGLGSVIIEGIAFPKCNQGLIGINKLFYITKQMKEANLKKQTITISIGEGVLECVLNSVNLTMLTEPNIYMQFSLNLTIVNHNLNPTVPEGSCKA